MIHYILQTIVFQFIFLLIYDVFLKKETFFKWNRLYLLSTAVLSLILPFIQIECLKKIVPQDYIISLPKVIMGQWSSASHTIILNSVVIEEKTVSVLEVVFCFGLGVAFCLFLFKMFKVFLLIRKNPKRSLGNVIVVNLSNSIAAFSFFNYIFLGTKLKGEERETVLKHELIHVNQKHTIDLLFFELLRVVFWFNPFVYMYQSRLAILHEFIADAHVLKYKNKQEYSENLLSQVFEIKNISFINNFFKQSFIKKRIVMLSKTKSKQFLVLKYLILIPIVVGMLIYTSMEAQDSNKGKPDLDQFLYTLKKGEELTGVKDKINQKQEAFLKKNKSYMSWSQVDEIRNVINYDVNYINEQVPVGFMKRKISFLGVEYKNTNEIPFATIDEVPIFPGCEEKLNEARKKCFSYNMSKHVSQNFNTDIANNLGLVGRQRINIMFKIDDKGSIIDIRSRASHPVLEKEAKRVIQSLPKMIPGKHKEKKVTVFYNLPIVFQVGV